MLVEENITTDSKSITTTTRAEEQKHTENIIRKWYDHDDNDENNSNNIQHTTFLPNKTMAEKIERILRKIDRWTNETTSIPINNNGNHMQRDPLQDKSFSNSNLSTYDNIHQDRECKSRSKKPISNSLANPFRQRYRSSAYIDPSEALSQQTSVHRPYSMVFTNDPSTSMTNISSVLTNDNYNDELDRKVRSIEKLRVNFLLLFAV